MDEYMDKKVIELRRKARQAEYNSIETGIYVNNKLIKFEEAELFDKKLKVFLPDNFTLMTEKTAKIKYPSENRPQVIYTNQEGTVNFTFSHFTLPIKSEETIQAIKQFKNMIQKVNPANIFYEMKEEDIEKNKVSWFDFKGYAIDSQIYNVMFVTSLEGTVLHGGFNCQFKDGNEWKPVIQLVMKSLKDKTIE